MEDGKAIFKDFRERTQGGRGVQNLPPSDARARRLREDHFLGRSLGIRITGAMAHIVQRTAGLRTRRRFSEMPPKIGCPAKTAPNHHAGQRVTGNSVSVASRCRPTCALGPTYAPDPVKLARKEARSAIAYPAASQVDDRSIGTDQNDVALASTLTPFPPSLLDGGNIAELKVLAHK